MKEVSSPRNYDRSIDVLGPTAQAIHLTIIEIGINHHVRYRENTLCIFSVDMPRTLLWLFSSLLASQVASAALPDGRLNANQIRRPVVPLVRFPTGPVKGSDGSELPSLDTTYYFEQLIDHNNPSLGTFQQRYWHTAQYYKHGIFMVGLSVEAPPDLLCPQVVQSS